jgi:anti-sigma factor RsiW
MRCERLEINEMLVPYVEGALAERERNQVMAHLRSCPVCQAEARQIKATILGLRAAVARSGVLGPTRHPAPEEICAAVLEPDSLEAGQREQVTLHLAECPDCAGEAQALQDMETELARRVEPAPAAAPLPRSLRLEIQKLYPGAPAVEPQPVAAALPWRERLAELLGRFHWKPLLATAVTAFVLTLGYLFVMEGQHSAEQASESLPRQPLPAVAGAPSPASPARQEAVSEESQMIVLEVAPNRTQEASKLLMGANIGYQTRDGQLYVADKDYEKARGLLAQKEGLLAYTDAESASPAASPPGEDNRARRQEPASPSPATPSPAPPSPAEPPSPAAPPSPQEQASPRPSPTPSPARRRTQVAALPSPRQMAQASPLPLKAQGPPPAPTPTSEPLEAADQGGNASGRAGQQGGSLPASEVAGAGPAGSATAPGAGPGASSGVTAPAPPASGARRATSTTAAAPLPPPPEAPPQDRAEALRPRAKQVAQALVGPAAVTVDSREDGTLVVTVRPQRPLSDADEEALRQRLRSELRLEEADTVSIIRSR